MNRIDEVSVLDDIHHARRRAVRRRLLLRAFEHEILRLCADGSDVQAVLDELKRDGILRGG